MTITTGPHKGEVRTFAQQILRPEDYDLSVDDGLNSGQGGIRTASVIAHSFVELQVLKRKDWRRLIDTNSGFLCIMESVANTRIKASRNARRKKHVQHISRGSDAWNLEKDIHNFAQSQRGNRSKRHQPLKSLVRRWDSSSNHMGPEEGSHDQFKSPPVFPNFGRKIRPTTSRHNKEVAWKGEGATT